MSDLTTNVHGPGRAGLGQAEARGTSEARGVFRGAETRVVDQASLIEKSIADMAEEITFAASEETEKDVSDREVEDGRKSNSLEHLLRLKEVQETLKSLGDLDQKQLMRALKRLLERAGQQGADADAFRRQAGEAFEEPAHQYAALTTLVSALKARGAPPEQIAQAEAAVKTLMEEKGPGIRAALNIGKAAQGFARSDLGTVKELRDSYRSHVHDYQSASAVLDGLVKEYGADKLEQGISFMLKALGADLAAAGASIDKTHLGLVLSDMTRLKTLTTVLGNCDILARSARKMGARRDYSGTRLLQQIAPLQDAPRVHKDNITKIPDQAGLKEIETQIRFLSDLREVVRLVPLESYAKPENRDRLIDACSDALIEKGDLEEQLEEDEE